MRTSRSNLILVFLLSLFSSNSVNCQNWALMHGTCTTSLAASYGTLGVGSATTYPGSRVSACAVTHTDGTMWLYGGKGYANSGAAAYFDDIWSFDPVTRIWTWKNGHQSNPLGVYGTLGVSSSTWYPGTRMGAFSWYDGNGNIWVFGGETSTTPQYITYFMNDLWKYNIQTDTWTWIHGTSNPNDAGAFGTMGVSSSSNIPSARANGASWVDGSGNFWLFGGHRTSGNYLSDLWKYDPTTNEWTWMHGSSFANQHANYTSVGVGSSTNTPGTRFCPVAWADNNNLWLFGGSAHMYGNSSWGRQNDLWKFNVTTGEWTCVNALTYTVSGVPSIRHAASGGKDANGKFLLSGGTGGFGSQSDVWRYDPSVNSWSLVVPSSTSGVCYATGVASPINQVPPNHLAQSWTDNCGDFWTMGGYHIYSMVNNMHNAVWKLNLSGPSASVSPVSLCPPASPTLSLSGPPTITWYNSPTSTVVMNTGSVLSTGSLSSGTHSYYASSSACPSNTIRTEVLVNVASLSFAGSNTTCAGGSVTQTVSGAMTYTWNTGATTPTIVLTPTATTQYTVVGTAPGNCTVSALKNITVYNNPTITVAGSTALCQANAVVTLTANGASTFSWAIGGATPNFTFIPSANLSNTVVGTDTLGCVGSKTLSIVVFPLPTVTVNSGSICAGTAFTLAPVGALNYNYSSGSAVVNPTTNTTYTVTGTDSNGCPSTSTANVNVVTTIINITQDSTVCLGDTAKIQLGGASSYSLNGQAVPPNVSFVPPASAVHTVSGFYAGCIGSKTVDIIVLPLPTLSVTTSKAVLCKGDQVVLSVSGSALSYTWSTGTNSQSFVATPSVGTSYTVTGVALNSCNASVSTSIVVSALTLSISGTTSVCSGQSTTLNLAGASTYSVNGVVSQQQVQLTPTASIIYTITGGDVYGCLETKNVSIAWHPLPVVGITSSDSVLCSGADVILTCSGNAASLQWNTGATTPVVVMSPTLPTTYSVTGYSSFGCENSASIFQNVIDCVGLDELVNPAVVIFPNPSKDVFVIVGLYADVESIRVYNSIGQLITSTNMAMDSRVIINLKDQRAGIYFLTYENKFIGKLMKE